MSTHSLTVILPCYNEQESISAVVGELVAQKASIKKQLGLSELKIILSNDGSTDQSMAQVEAFADEVQVVGFKKNQGYGAALKRGYAETNTDLIAFYDLDCTCSASDLVPLIVKLRSENLDMISGIRLHSESRMPLSRRVGNSLYAFLVKTLLGQSVADCCSGYRVFRSAMKDQYIENLPDNLNHTLAMTIYTLRSGKSYGEAAIKYGERSGTSKLNVVSDGILFLLSVFKYSWR